MIEEQPTLTVSSADLPEKAAQLKKEGYRLVHICCMLAANNACYDIIYSFDKEWHMQNLLVAVPREDAILPSITPSFLCAFTYENEMKDLFGMTVMGLNPDFGGHFIKTKVKVPFVADRPISSEAVGEGISVRSVSTGEGAATPPAPKKEVTPSKPAVSPKKEASSPKTTEMPNSEVK